MRRGHPGPGAGLPTSSLTSEKAFKDPGYGDVLHFPSKSESLPTSCASAKLSTVHAVGHWNEVEAVITQESMGPRPNCACSSEVSLFIPPVPAGHRGVWPPSPWLPIQVRLG